MQDKSTTSLGAELAGAAHEFRHARHRAKLLINVLRGRVAKNNASGDEQDHRMEMARHINLAGEAKSKPEWKKHMDAAAHHQRMVNDLQAHRTRVQQGHESRLRESLPDYKPHELKMYLGLLESGDTHGVAVHTIKGERLMDAYKQRGTKNSAQKKPVPSWKNDLERIHSNYVVHHHELEGQKVEDVHARIVGQGFRRVSKIDRGGSKRYGQLPETVHHYRHPDGRLMFMHSVGSGAMYMTEHVPWAKNAARPSKQSELWRGPSHRPHAGLSDAELHGAIEAARGKVAGVKFGSDVERLQHPDTKSLMSLISEREHRGYQSDVRASRIRRHQFKARSPKQWPVKNSAASDAAEAASRATSEANKAGADTGHYAHALAAAEHRDAADAYLRYGSKRKFKYHSEMAHHHSLMANFHLTGNQESKKRAAQVWAGAQSVKNNATGMNADQLSSKAHDMTHQISTIGDASSKLHAHALALDAHMSAQDAHRSAIRELQARIAHHRTAIGAHEHKIIHHDRYISLLTKLPDVKNSSGSGWLHTGPKEHEKTDRNQALEKRRGWMDLRGGGSVIRTSTGYKEYRKAGGTIHYDKAGNIIGFERTPGVNNSSPAWTPPIGFTHTRCANGSTVGAFTGSPMISGFSKSQTAQNAGAGKSLEDRIAALKTKYAHLVGGVDPSADTVTIKAAMHDGSPSKLALTRSTKRGEHLRTIDLMHASGYGGVTVNGKDDSWEKQNGGFANQDHARAAAREFAFSSDAARDLSLVPTHHNHEGANFPALEVPSKRRMQVLKARMDQFGVKYKDVGNNTVAVWHPSMKMVANSGDRSDIARDKESWAATRAARERSERAYDVGGFGEHVEAMELHRKAAELHKASYPHDSEKIIERRKNLVNEHNAEADLHENWLKRHFGKRMGSNSSAPVAQNVHRASGEQAPDLEKSLRAYEAAHKVWFSTPVHTDAGKAAKKSLDEARTAYEDAVRYHRPGTIIL